MKTKLLLWVGLAVLSAAVRVEAQCANVTLSPYGVGCATQFDVPVLKGAFDAAACAVDLAFSGQSGCCNTFLSAKFILLGIHQVSIPAPGIGPGCLLLVDPLLIVALPASVTDLHIPLPPVTGVTGFLQVVNQYTTFGVVNDYNLSNGLAFKIG